MVLWQSEKAGGLGPLDSVQAQVSRWQPQFSFQGSDWGGFECSGYFTYCLVLQPLEGSALRFLLVPPYLRSKVSNGGDAGLV